MHHSDITIIGGGVMGLMTAREFLNAGATVTVLEKMNADKNRRGRAVAFCRRFILGDKRNRLQI